MQEPDPQVVAAAKRGDLRAFEELVCRYQAEVWRLALHFVHEAAAADDITQEAFVRVFRFLPRYRGDSKFSTWLLSIARNCALDELRRAQRRRRTAGVVAAEPPRLASDESTGIEVREAVAALPLDLREPVVLIDMFGLSYREVAKMLNLPSGTVKSRVHRARLQLAAMLMLEPEGKRHEL